MSQPGGNDVKRHRISSLNVFFQAVRQHGWDDSLPGRAAFYAGDTPPIRAQVDRRLAEFVMAQVESPANLDRWPDLSAKLVTLILTRCGLRVSSALSLAFDCVVHDGQGAAYLRYFNTKMKREAAVPIDEELEAGIGEQQRRVLRRWPDGTPLLFPRERSNVSGNVPLDPATYRRKLNCWLQACDIHDEHGGPPTWHASIGRDQYALFLPRSGRGYARRHRQERSEWVRSLAGPRMPAASLSLLPGMRQRPGAIPAKKPTSVLPRTRLLEEPPRYPQPDTRL